jgi:hypothetical protein
LDSRPTTSLGICQRFGSQKLFKRSPSSPGPIPHLWPLKPPRCVICQPSTTSEPPTFVINNNIYLRYHQHHGSKDGYKIYKGNKQTLKRVRLVSPLHFCHLLPCCCFSSSRWFQTKIILVGAFAALCFHEGFDWPKVENNPTPRRPIGFWPNVMSLPPMSAIRRVVCQQHKLRWDP